MLPSLIILLLSYICICHILIFASKRRIARRWFRRRLLSTVICTPIIAGNHHYVAPSPRPLYLPPRPKRSSIDDSPFTAFAIVLSFRVILPIEVLMAVVSGTAPKRSCFLYYCRKDVRSPIQQNFIYRHEVYVTVEMGVIRGMQMMKGCGNIARTIPQRFCRKDNRSSEFIGRKTGCRAFFRCNFLSPTIDRQGKLQTLKEIEPI